MTDNLPHDEDWVPEACTLPTVDQPLRRAEFDALFGDDVIHVEQTSPDRLRLDLRPEPDTAARAAALAVEETRCCSFFAFDLAIAEGRVSLTVASAAAQTPVLRALRDRATARAGGAG